MDPVLLIAVLSALLGVPLIILVSYLLGGWRTAELGSEAEALDLLRADDPDFRTDAILLSADGSAAVAFEAKGRRVGLVRAVGDEFVVRFVAPAELQPTSLTSNNGCYLEVRLRDFTFPTLRVKLSEQAGDADAWISRLRDFAG